MRRPWAEIRLMCGAGDENAIPAGQTITRLPIGSTRHRPARSREPCRLDGWIAGPTGRPGSLRSSVEGNRGDLDRTSGGRAGEQ